jgi:hypothetical protein
MNKVSTETCMRMVVVAISHSKGYGLEHEVEQLLMGLEDQQNSTPLGMRTHRQPASGAMDCAKGDVVTNLRFLELWGQWMVECKDRKNARGDGKSVSIKKDELDKARKEAEQNGMHPLFAFKVKQPVGGNRQASFNDKINPMNTKWFAMPFGTFLNLMEYVRDLKAEVDSHEDAAA